MDRPFSRLVVLLRDKPDTTDDICVSCSVEPLMVWIRCFLLYLSLEGAKRADEEKTNRSLYKPEMGISDEVDE